MIFYLCEIQDNNLLNRKSMIESPAEKIYLAKNKKELLKKISNDKKIFIKIKKQEFKKHIPEKVLKDFFLKVGRLLKAGIAIKKAMEFQKGNGNNLHLRYKVSNVYDKLDRGEDFYTSLKFEELIQEKELLIMYVSENAGNIADGFFRIAYLKEKNEKLKSDLQIALSYPLFILCISIIIILLIFFFIVPNFKSIYEQSTASLPLITRVILFIQEVISKYIFFILFAVVGLFLFLFSNLGKKFLKNSFLLKKFLLKKNIINILENLSTLLESGVSIDKGIEIIISNLENGYLKNKIFILRNIKKGESLSKCFQKINILTEEEIGLISVGEESGTVSSMLKEIALLREENFNKKTKILVKLAEPCLLLIIGIFISIFVIGLYLPILNMDSVLSI